MIINTNDVINSAYKLQIENICKKYEYIFEIYISIHKSNYEDIEIDRLKKCLNALLFKFTLTILFLELLWKQSEINRENIATTLDNSIIFHNWSDSEKILGSAFLEGTLFEARAFLDIYERFCCLLFKYSKPNTAGTQAFYRILENKINEPFKKNAKEVSHIFQTEVFGEEKWGNKLKSLRDKIAHFDIINPNFEGAEVVNGILLDWPTLNKKTYDRFLQENVLNELFLFMTSMAKILFGIEWMPGTIEEFKKKYS